MSVQVIGPLAFDKGDVFNKACPSRVVLDHVTSRWGVLVLAALSEGSMRFSELRRGIGGVSEKMLAQTLRALDHDGFVDREVTPSSPPQVSYRLTELGRELAGHVTGLLGWINENLPRVTAARADRSAP